MKTLVDTGATNSIISQLSLSKIRHHQIYPVQQQFFLANKTFISIVGYVMLEIKIQHIRTYVVAAITETLCCDLILGEDWINYYQVTIDRFTNKIKILGNKAAVPLRTSSSDLRVPIKLRYSLSIPPHTEKTIKGVTPISQASKVLFSPNVHLQGDKNIVFPQEVIQIQNGHTNLIVNNGNDYSIHLTYDTILGFISFPKCVSQMSNKNETEWKNSKGSNNEKEFANQSLSSVAKGRCYYGNSDHDKHSYYKTYNSAKSRHVQRIQPSVNTINNATQVTVSVANDIETTLNQAIQHIGDLQEKNTTKRIIEKYRKVFDTSVPTIALTPIYHTIPTGDHPPINSVPYRGSLQQQQALKKMINQLEKSNQIRPSSSPWSSPVILIKKKDGDFRFVVDYRKLNSITTKDSYPIPTIESTLQQLAGNCYFSKLDLRSAYFQIPISEMDKPKTAFITTTGLWEFNVLPMGLTNAPPSFQRIMYNLIGKGREDYCLVYIDDIIIFSKTFTDHMENLDEILSILDKHRFQLNSSKCSIMRTAIDYLGHSISKSGITPLHDNIKAIRELPIPDHPTLKQANEFIGGLGFYRKFIKNFSKIASPLHRVTNLTKDNKHKFIWGEEQRQAVQHLKQIITGPDLVLEFPDPKLSYVLATDASKIGLGAVLKQITTDGKIKIIHYLSRVLTSSESRYSTTELEALAMVWAITKLRPYLLGKDFQVETDHCPLCQFHKKRSRNGRLDRWAIEILSEYNITEIKYKKGKCHCDADLLSRYPLHTKQQLSKDVSTRKQRDGYLFPHVDEVYDIESDIQPTASINIITRSASRANNKQQVNDVHLTNRTSSNNSNTTAKTYDTQSIIKGTQGNIDLSSSSESTNLSASTADAKLNSTSPLVQVGTEVLAPGIGFSMKKIQEEQLVDNEIQNKMKNVADKENYETIDSIVYKLVPRGRTKIKLIWIPKSMIKQVLFLHHDHHTAGHLGNNKTFAKLVNKYYWPGMYKTISDYIKSCAECAKHNYRRTKLPGRMNITTTPNEVMGLVGMDYWGPANQLTANGNRYVITMTDYLSKFVFAKAVRTNSAQEAAEFFLDICYHYGAPTKLITDQGSHFVAELTRTIINSCYTTHILATPYHPMSNAQTERFNATFAPALAKLCNEQKQDWDDFLQPVIYAYNTSQHKTTTFTPFQLMFCRQNPLLMDPKQMKISLSKPNEYYDRIKQSRKVIIDHAKWNIQYQGELAKTRYDQNRPAPVYKINDVVLVRTVNKTSKFQAKYEGPYRIIAQQGPSTFIVKIEDPDSDYNPNYTKQVTISDIKLVYTRES